MLPKVLVTTAILAILQTAVAEQGVAERKFSLRLEYQFATTGEFDTPGGLIDLGETDTHVLLLSASYSLNERWLIFGSIPYVRKRHTGPFAHNLSEFVNYTPPSRRIVDDGQYHGGFQDVFIGAQYLAIDGPVSVSPYFSVGGPVADYPIYGNAIIGKHLWEIPVGVNVHFTPYFSDWFFEADISYVFSERVMDVDLDYWLLHAAAGYYLTPRFAPRLFLVKRHAPTALDLGDIPNFDTEAGYHHDRTLKHSYLNGGIGFDYIISDRYSVSASYYETIEQDVLAKIDAAFTMAVTYRF